MAAFRRIRRILVPTDLSDAARAAYPAAVEQARRGPAEVILLHVMEWYPYVTLEGGVIPLQPPEYEKDIRDRLAKEAGRLGGVDVRTKVRAGPAADGILREAECGKADLIVMSTHGRSGVARWILGSVAERVVRGASCPVLTVKPETPARTKKPAAAPVGKTTVVSI